MLDSGEFESALVYKDGRVLTGISLGCDLSPDFWSADGSMMVSQSGDLIDVGVGKKLMRIKGTGRPSNKHAGRVLVRDNNRIKVYDIKTKEMVITFGLGGLLGNHWSISGDGTEVIAVSVNEYLKIKNWRQEMRKFSYFALTMLFILFSNLIHAVVCTGNPPCDQIGEGLGHQRFWVGDNIAGKRIIIKKWYTCRDSNPGPTD